MRVSGPDIKVRGSFFLTVTVVWKGGDIATIRERSGSEERSWGDRVRVAKAEREEGSLPVMVEWGCCLFVGCWRMVAGVVLHVEVGGRLVSRLV